MGFPLKVVKILSLAGILRETGTNGTVIAIDTFLGSLEHWDRGGRDGNLMPCKNGRPLLYEQSDQRRLHRNAGFGRPAAAKQ
jgi:hypothetical protein